MVYSSIVYLALLSWWLMGFPWVGDWFSSCMLSLSTVFLGHDRSTFYLRPPSFTVTSSADYRLFDVILNQLHSHGFSQQTSTPVSTTWEKAAMPRSRSVPSARTACCTLVVPSLDENFAATFNSLPRTKELVRNLEEKLETKFHSVFGGVCRHIRVDITLESAPSRLAMRAANKVTTATWAAGAGTLDRVSPLAPTPVR